MKNFVSAIIIVCSPLFYLAQWNLIYNHGDLENAIHVLNKDTVVAVTQSGGRIHRTIDGGSSWTFDQTIFTQSWFNDVHFPDQLVGYACGGTAFGTHKNVIAKSIDAGATWDSITSNSYMGYSFTRIFFVHADTGFVAGEYDGLLKTVNGGGTFTPVSFPQGGQGTAIHFYGSQLRFAASTKYLSTNKYRFSILRTQNQGASWTETWIDTMNNVTGLSHRIIRDIQFVTPLLGYAVGGNGLFLKTINGGLSWTTSTVTPANELLTVNFTDISTGYTNIGGGISQTMNGSSTWSPQLLTTPTTISQIRFANDSVGYAVGAAGIYKSIQKSNLVSIREVLEKSSLKLYPNPSKDFVYLNGNLSEGSEIKIISVTGQPIRTIQTEPVIDVYDLLPGFYFLVLKQGNKEKVVKFCKY